MIRFLLTDRVPPQPMDGSLAEQVGPDNFFLCPILKGLSAGQADCAIVMPIGNANDQLLQDLKDCEAVSTKKSSDDNQLGAAILCADPFIKAEIFANKVRAYACKNIINWPSAIFFEDRTKQAMAAIPALAEQEYQWLAKAQDQGLKAHAFILSQDHARIALSYGIRMLILHPGLPHSLNPEQDSRLAASLRGMMSNIRQLDAAAKILIYRHPLLLERLPFEELGADGYVDYRVGGAMS